MSIKRLLVLAGLLAVVGCVGRGNASAVKEGQDEEAFIREHPDALVYKGFYLYVAKDYEEAVRAWERYLQVAPADADRASVRALIARARRDAGGSR